MKITREKLRLWGACYNDERIAELVPEAGLTPLEVAALDIPAEDRLWVLLREDIIPARDLRLLACGWAEAAGKAAWAAARAAESATSEAEFAAVQAARAAARAAAREPEWAAWSAVQAARAAAAEEQLADVVRVLRAGTNNTPPRRAAKPGRKR